MAEPAFEAGRVALQVDGRRLEARAGERLLEVCLANGIYIPNLCHLPGMDEPAASWRTGSTAAALTARVVILQPPLAGGR